MTISQKYGKTYTGFFQNMKTYSNTHLQAKFEENLYGGSCLFSHTYYDPKNLASLTWLAPMKLFTNFTSFFHRLHGCI